MLDYAGENLHRLMVGGGLSIREVADRAGLDERTIRGVLGGGKTPHIHTIHRLANALGVKVDEFFVDPAQLLYRRFDRQTNPVVAEVLESHAALFDGWSEADFNELHSRVGAGGALTVEGTLAAVGQMNRKRELHDKLDLLLESSQAEVAAGILNVLYEKVVIGG
jgi:transcriptional regulator with XRE-family HTH domain